MPAGGHCIAVPFVTTQPVDAWLYMAANNPKSAHPCLVCMGSIVLALLRQLLGCTCPYPMLKQQLMPGGSASCTTCTSAMKVA